MNLTKAHNTKNGITVVTVSTLIFLRRFLLLSSLNLIIFLISGTYVNRQTFLLNVEK